MNLSPEQNLLFSLLKTSLCFRNNREAFSVIHGEIDWNSLINLAARQGVLCVACIVCCTGRIGVYAGNFKGVAYPLGT